jgi:uncharacterized protein (TIGR02271 family)
VIVDQTGLRGTIEWTNGDNVRVRLEDGRTVVIPRSLLIEQDETHYRVDLDFSRLHMPSEESLVVPVLAEDLIIDKEAVENTVRIRKHVREETVLVDEALRRDEVTVERVPVDRYVTQPLDVRYEGDTMIIPLMEEVLVVEKRLLLREEVRVTRQQKVIHIPEEHTLRREEVTVERTESPSSKPGQVS